MSPADEMAKKKKQRGNPHVPKVFRCNLNKLRTDKGLSLRDVEKGTGLTNATLWRIEQGCDVQLSSVIKIVKFFGVNIGDVWSELPKPEVIR